VHDLPETNGAVAARQSYNGHRQRRGDVRDNRSTGATPGKLLRHGSAGDAVRGAFRNRQITIGLQFPKDDRDPDGSVSWSRSSAARDARHADGRRKLSPRPARPTSGPNRGGRQVYVCNDGGFSARDRRPLDSGNHPKDYSAPISRVT